jgi:hypothetical protein
LVAASLLQKQKYVGDSTESQNWAGRMRSLDRGCKFPTVLLGDLGLFFFHFKKNVEKLRMRG